MSGRVALAAAALILLAGFAAEAHARLAQVPRYIVAVRNTTAGGLTCMVQVEGSSWEKLYIVAGQQWERRVTQTNAAVSMKCAWPVRQVLFKLAPGRRYVLVRDGKDRSVSLREVTADS